MTDSFSETAVRVTQQVSDVNRVIAVYRRAGYYSVKVSPKIIRLSENRVNLVYEIDEGDETKVKQINFVGNNAFSANDLKGVIGTQQYSWWRFFNRNDNYDADRIEQAASAASDVSFDAAGTASTIGNEPTPRIGAKSRSRLYGRLSRSTVTTTPEAVLGDLVDGEPHDGAGLVVHDAVFPVHAVDPAMLRKHLAVVQQRNVVPLGFSDPHRGLKQGIEFGMQFPEMLPDLFQADSVSFIHPLVSLIGEYIFKAEYFLEHHFDHRFHFVSERDDRLKQTRNRNFITAFQCN